MKLKTRDLGEVEITEAQQYEFVQPLFGFESHHRYALLFHEQFGDKIGFLQSMEQEDLCFILSDPTAIKPDYQPTLSSEDTALLGEGEYYLWLVTVVAEDFRDSTVNLRSPIVFNPDKQIAAQILLGEEYPVRSRMFEEGAVTC